MPLFSGKHVFVGLDAGSATVAVVERGPRRARLTDFARHPLAPGALEPGASGLNVVRPEEVGEAVRQVLSEVDGPGARVTLVLPDGVARLAPMEVPAGATPGEYVRFRLGTSLPWPASEATFDLLDLGRRRVIGAAVRRATIARYEQLAVAAGLSVDRVHLAPLVAVGGILARGRGRGAVVHALLGDVALCLVGFRDGELVAFRSRRRDRSGDEAAWLREEAERATAGAENGNGRGRLELLVSGPGSGELSLALGAGSPGGAVNGAERWPEASEAAWVGGALA